MTPLFSLESFSKHLNELRLRLIKSALFFLLACFVAYPYVDSLLPFLTLSAGNLVFTSPGEAFGAYMMLTITLGIILASPYIFYQIWSFVAHALKPTEKKFVFIFGPLSIIFFLLGCLFAYFVAIPLTYKFLMSFASEHMRPMITVSSYMEFLTNMLIVFGVTFELPLVLAFLAKIGIASPEFLRQKRRHAIIIILIVAAIATPPDVISQLLLTVPLILLYEIGILFVRWVYRPSQG